MIFKTKKETLMGLEIFRTQVVNSKVLFYQNNMHDLR